MSLETIYDAILNGDAKKSAAEVAAALEAKVPAEDILHKACIPAMGEVGRLFEEGERFVPEMLISARAMQAGMNLLQPHLVEANVKSAGKVLVGTVAGDLHDIGKNLVAMMMESAGLEVFNLGVDIKPEKFVEEVKSKNANILAISSTLSS